jgi:hypothetical protein
LNHRKSFTALALVEPFVIYSAAISCGCSY